jgi:ribose 5-phosphate isomerase B
MTTRDRVIATIAEVLEVPESEVQPGSRFLDDLGATSLDIVNLIWRVEEVFSLGETPESVLEGIESVSDLIDLVDAMRSDEPSEAVEVVDVMIASDHAGVELKAELTDWLREHGWSYVDLGPADTTSVDYPSFAGLLGKRVARKDARLGVLICGTGIGMSIAANKVAGIRAAVAGDPVSARATRQHNDANVLCLGARIIGRDIAIECLVNFLETEFDPGSDNRHRRRVAMITDLESELGLEIGSDPST